MAVLNVVIGALAVAAACGWLVYTGPLGGLFFMGAAVSYLLGAVMIFKWIGLYHPHNKFGGANTVTLARFVLSCVFAGLAVQITVAPVLLSTTLVWTFFVLASVERALDGIDGYLARRQQMETPFGARFDMEVDALQILLLSIIAFEFDKAGSWVLAAGALRYIFWGASVWFPMMNRPLPPSFRRKAVAVIQGVSLAALLVPNFAPPSTTAVAAFALGLLIYSFAVDTLWLFRTRPRTTL